MSKKDPKTVKRETTSIRIDPEIWLKAKVHATQERMSIGEYIEKMLKKELKLK